MLKQKIDDEVSSSFVSPKPETISGAERAGLELSAMRSPRHLPKAVTTLLVLVGAVLVWYVVSLFSSPLFLPGPGRVAAAAIHLSADGALLDDIGISYFRVIVGWIL
jgi:ABC-type nitrate/sulfonate/bicarbonate transport system permease component